MENNPVIVSVCAWICAVLTALQFAAMGFCTGLLLRLRRVHGTCPVCGGVLTRGYRSRTASFVYLDCPHCKAHLQGSLKRLLKSIQRLKWSQAIVKITAILLLGVNIGTSLLAIFIWDGTSNFLLDIFGRHILMLPVVLIGTAIATIILLDAAVWRRETAWLYRAATLTCADDKIVGLQD